MFQYRSHCYPSQEQSTKIIVKIDNVIFTVVDNYNDYEVKFDLFVCLHCFWYLKLSRLVGNSLLNLLTLLNYYFNFSSDLFFYCIRNY